MSTVIGIGGVSRSGKSDLTEKMKSYFSDKKVLVIEQDKYVLDEQTIPKIKDRTDWEHPESIDFERIVETIQKQRNAYDLVIVEGLLAFHNESLNNLYDLRVCMEISNETFLQRRKEESRWGVEPAWYWGHVWDSYLKFGQPSNHPTMTVSGAAPVSEETFQKIVRNILS